MNLLMNNNLVGTLRFDSHAEQVIESEDLVDQLDILSRLVGLYLYYAECLR